MTNAFLETTDDDGVQGISVAIIGADGAGKSTLIRGLKSVYPRPIRLVKVRVNAVFVERRPGPVRWFARTLRCVSILSKARLAVTRGEIVVWDRHPMEDRYMGPLGRRVLGRGRGYLAALAPLPDVVVLLDAPVTVLHARRREQDPKKLERLRETFLRLAAVRPSIVVDATLPTDAILDEVAEAIEEYLGSSLRPSEPPCPGSPAPGGGTPT